MDNFIEIYDESLSKSFCNHLINKFEKDDRKRLGLTLNGTDLKIKNSSDVTISGKSDWMEEEITIHKSLVSGLFNYVKKYPYHLLSTGLKYEKTNEWLTPNDILSETDEVVNNCIQDKYIPDYINLQKYNKKEGHYNHYHSEISGLDESLYRSLVFMFYLNDVKEGGETEFYHQKIKIKPKAGTLVLFPAGFTHTHKGNMPISNDKYILTSWVCYNNQLNKKK